VFSKQGASAGCGFAWCSLSYFSAFWIPLIGRIPKSGTLTRESTTQKKNRDFGSLVFCLGYSYEVRAKVSLTNEEIRQGLKHFARRIKALMINTGSEAEATDLAKQLRGGEVAAVRPDHDPHACALHAVHYSHHNDRLLPALC
jgi:hypothetical protein